MNVIGTIGFAAADGEAGFRSEAISVPAERTLALKLPVRMNNHHM